MYTEYFNIITNGAPNGSLFLPIAIIFLVYGLLFFRFKKLQSKMIKILPFIIIISIIASIYSNSVTNKEYKILKNVLINKEHSVVEGVVKDFIPMDEFNPESFSVNGIVFSYRNDEKSGSFNTLASNGSPIKNGLDVRLFYYENSILGLWVKE